MKMRNSTLHVGTAALGGPVEQRSTGFSTHACITASNSPGDFRRVCLPAFLTRSKLNSSRASYALFLKEQENPQGPPAKMLLTPLTPPPPWIGWMFLMSEPAISVQALRKSYGPWKQSKVSISKFAR